MKKTKIVTIILSTILIALVAFAGIYLKKQNRMENIIKDYELGMNIEGSRVVQLEAVGDENVIVKDGEGNVISEELTEEQIEEKGYTKEITNVKSEEKFNIQNYKKSKEIIEKRLKGFGVEEYLIRLNEENGTIKIEIPENVATDYIVSNVGRVSKFQIIDTDTKEELMSNKDIKDVKVFYGRVSEETSDVSVYLSFEFTKEGTKKLEEITNNYVTVEEVENTESTNENTSEESEEEINSENESTTKEKTITMKIDDQDIISTSLGEPITNGILQLTMGRATTNEKTLQENLKSATAISTLLINGELPLHYDIDINQYVLSNLQEKVDLIMLAIAIISIIFVVILCIKYRILGLICGITSIGVLALTTLLIRYTDIDVNLETLLGIIIIIILNFTLILRLLNKVKYSQELKKGIKEVFVKFFVQIIPICIIAIVFSFIKWNPIYNFGLTMFWGLFVIAVYNLLVTRTILLLKENK